MRLFDISPLIHVIYADAAMMPPCRRHATAAAECSIELITIFRYADERHAPLLRADATSAADDIIFHAVYADYDVVTLPLLPFDFSPYSLLRATCRCHLLAPPLLSMLFAAIVATLMPWLLMPR